MSATSTVSGCAFARAAALAAAAALLSACAAKPLIGGPAPQPAAVPFVVPPQANVELVVTEAVAGPEQDTASFTKVFVDGKPIGQTAVAPRSQERRWSDLIPAGNHLFRFEQWYLPQVGEWGALDAQWQPPERFIRVADGSRTSITLRFSEGGRHFDFAVTRRPLP